MIESPRFCLLFSGRIASIQIANNLLLPDKGHMAVVAPSRFLGLCLLSCVLLRWRMKIRRVRGSTD